jgi:hypothetical protein
VVGDTSTGVILVCRWPAGRIAEPPGLTPWGDQHVNNLAELVNTTVGVAPLASDFHVGLVGMPSIPDGVAAGPSGLGQQFLDVAVGQPEAQVPARRQHDYVEREAKAGEGRAGYGSGAR